MTDDCSVLRKEADYLVQQLLGNKPQMSVDFINRLLDICKRSRGKDLLEVNFGTKNSLEGGVL